MVGVPTALKSGHQPHLPQRTVPLQRSGPDLAGQLAELPKTAGRGEYGLMDVGVDHQVGIVFPDRVSPSGQ